MIFSFLLSLFGRRDKYILDGPGMERTHSWEEFTLSCCESCRERAFSFRVRSSFPTCTVTGECRDEDGNIYKSEEEKTVSKEDFLRLRDMELDMLEDISKDPNSDESEENAVAISLLVKYPEEEEKRKAISEELSMEIYRLFLPYFKG